MCNCVSVKVKVRVCEGDLGGLKQEDIFWTKKKKTRGYFGD